MIKNLEKATKKKDRQPKKSLTLLFRGTETHVESVPFIDLSHPVNEETKEKHAKTQKTIPNPNHTDASTDGMSFKKFSYVKKMQQPPKCIQNNIKEHLKGFTYGVF